jgi:hypothetical protein
VINEHIEFEQIYNISPKIVSKRELKLNYSIDFGEYASHPKIVIHHDSAIPYQSYKPQELYTLITSEINKIKAENSILLNLFDEAMTKNLKGFVNHIYAGKFIKRIRLPLFDGIEPEITGESRLILYFQENHKNNQVIEVEEGELLIEFVKPIYGKNGLNAHGKEITSGFSNNKYDLQAEIDNESIEIIDEARKKLYKSKKKGYVIYNQMSLSVSNKINMSSLSRNNDSVASEENNNIEVLISQNDTDRDSVGEGVALKSETIHITGHVGGKSILEAINLKIDGATHKDSTQFAKFANINRHKGKLRCHEAKITLLEGGEVHATNVNIEASLGGVIYAKDVIIGHVKNNLKVYASNSITIKLISGEDNVLKINYKEVPILISKLNLIKNDYSELKYHLEEANRHNKEQVPILEDKIRKLKKEDEDIRNSVIEAKITIEKPLRGLNTIIFTIDENNEFIFKTEAVAYEPFLLKIDEDKITLLPTHKTIAIKS